MPVILIHTRRRLAALICLLLFSSTSLAQQQVVPRALDPELRTTQYLHNVWQTADGLPQSSVYAIVQTRDSYLWLGTQEGLARFDGVEFTVYDKAQVDWLQSNEIWALLEDREGGLWIGTSGGGVTRLHNGQSTTYTTDNGLPSNMVKALHEDRAGNIWIGTIQGGVSRFDGTSFTHYTTADDLAGDIVLSIGEDHEGNIWIGTQTGLSRFYQGRFIRYTKREGLPGEMIRAIYAGNDGGVWIGTERGLARYDHETLSPYQMPRNLCGQVVSALYQDPAGTLWIGTLDGGVCRLSEGTFAPFTTGEGLTHNQVRTFYQSRSGSLWIGTDGGGLNQLANGKFVPITSAEGLSGNVVTSVLEDRDGVVWLGTEGGGLNRLEDGRLTHFTTADGLPSNYVYALHADRRGRLWIGMFDGGLCRFDGQHFTCFTTSDGLSSDNVYSIHEDREGSLWIGTDAGLTRFHDDQFTVLTMEDGLSADWVTALHEDRAGNLWIGTSGDGLNRLLKDDTLLAYSVKDGLSSNFVLALHEDAAGTLWIGTKEGGLCRLQAGRFACFTTRDGLHNDNVLQILEDEQGYLWLASQQGISRVSKKELHEHAAGTRSSISSIIYGRSDGLKSIEGFGGSQPAAWKSQDGRLWFSTLRGVAVIDPSSIQVNPIPPPVVLERLVVDGEPVDLTQPIRLPAGSKNLEFDYTALSFVAPKRITFRYKLEGYDGNWVEAGARRSAYYTNLPPGSYRFHVIASNSDRIWNEAGAALAFSKAPFFHQTLWFYLLCAVGLLVAGAGSYSLRVRNLRKRQHVLQDLVEEQTRELRSREHELEFQVQRQARLAEQVRSLASALTLAEQKERRRLSQILHDDLQQVLYAVQMKLQFLIQDIPPKDQPLIEQMSDARDLVRQAVETTRQLTVDISPLVLRGEGLVEALYWLNVQMEKVHGLKVELQAHNITSILTEDMRALLFQLVRELLFNVVKHAGVPTATVALQEKDQQLIIQVRDEGAGFDSTRLSNGKDHRGGFGLISVRERTGYFGGRLEVASAPGKGTCVTIVVPIEAEVSLQDSPAFSHST